MEYLVEVVGSHNLDKKEQVATAVKLGKVQFTEMLPHPMQKGFFFCDKTAILCSHT